jgi:F0F1-type ATP synthase beta subunit
MERRREDAGRLVAVARFSPVDGANANKFQSALLFSGKVSRAGKSAFTRQALPGHRHALLRAAKESQIAIKALMQLDAQHVRGIALRPTQGLAWGMAVEDTGGPLKVPVGRGILSRMFDVFGNVIDRLPTAARRLRPVRIVRSRRRRPIAPTC